jgi:hypothetical protein
MYEAMKALITETSLVRFSIITIQQNFILLPMRSLDFSIDLTLPAALWPLGFTQLLTEMSTRNLPEGKGRPARKADLTAICEPTV